MRRAIVDASFAASCFTPYEEFWSPGAATHIRAKAVALHVNAIELSTGSIVAYDVLVVAPGLAYPLPFRAVTDDERAAEWGTVAQLGAMARQRDTLAASQHVVVVGGGTTGCETAAEVKVRGGLSALRWGFSLILQAAFPDKSVTLMHSKSRLLDRQKEVSPADAARVREKLEGQGVEVQLGMAFQAAGDGSAVLRCSGGAAPNTHFLPPQLLDERGFVRTDEHLRVPGRRNVLAMGDAVAGAAPSLKTAMYLHAPVVAANVRHLLRDEAPSARIGRLPSVVDSFLVVTLGPHDSYSHGLAGALYAPSKRKDFRIHNVTKSFTVA